MSAMDEADKQNADALDEFDKNLLNRLQSDFPISPRPFKDIADAIGSSEERVIDAVKRLKDSGIIRRLGGVFSSRDLGFYSTLVAARIPPQDIEDAAAVIGEYKEVTHNYEREHEYNLWFTLTATSKERAAEIIEEIRQETSVIDIHELPAVEFYKVDVKFAV